MAMSAEDIKGYVREAFPDAQFELRDLAGDGDHYELIISAKAFRGISRVAQHQMVYAALKGHMGSTLHALALKTSAPA
jgi:stress-induced morphogen